MKRLFTTVAVGALAPTLAFAQPIADCTLVDGALPPGCVEPNAGTAVAMPTGANVELEQYQGELGEEGFVIVVDAVTPGADPVFVEGNRTGFNEFRRVDRLLDAANVQVRFDGLTIEPRLAIATSDLRTSYVAGDTVNFRASSNYPAFIARAEVRVMDANRPGRVVAILPVQPNGEVAWTMPSNGVAEMVYALRVYDAQGRYDETQRLTLQRSASRLPAAQLNGPIIAAGEGEDMTRRRTIRVNGGAVTVSSNDVAPGSRVIVMGETVPVDAGGNFVVQRILPQGWQTVRVGVGGRKIDKEVEIPEQDWFYIAVADLTVGQEDGDTYSIGRLSGYAKGRMANGLDITASIDTGEREIDELFDDIFTKEPLGLLDTIRDQDVYLTFGDDSTTIDGAPTSGKIYLKVQKDRSHLLFGDFKVTEQGQNLVRSDRTLFGVQGHYESNSLTEEGEPRVRVTAYGAQPDRLAQRDVLEGTGGAAYFLSRQGILAGSATVYVQYRDPVSGIVISQRPLVEGQDYEINYFQGVVLLNGPLAPFTGDGLLRDNPLGSSDVALVVQYEYAPTFGDVDGTSAGIRAESWVTDNVRLGFSAQKESTGIADNRLVGADMLVRQSELTYANFEWARSEGPGFGALNSINGGLDFDPSGPSNGVEGEYATAFRFEGRADLAEISNGAMSGFASAYYDKKEDGFVSADYDIAEDQEAYGVATEIDLSQTAKLRFEYDYLEVASGRQREDALVGLTFALGQTWTAEVAALHTDREDPGAAPEANGERTDVALRVTYSPHDDLSVWGFVQNTVDSSGGLPDNDRYGVGARAKITDRVTFDGEVSDGDLGEAGYARLTYQKNAATQYHMGYRLDPMRKYENASFTGDDGGTWVLGATSQVTDDVQVRAENTYDLAGDRPSLASTFGVNYTPSDVWSYDLGLIYGEDEDPVRGTLRREGLSFGVYYNAGEIVQGGLRGEYRVEDGEDDDTLDRETWGLSGYYRYKFNEETRLLANIDALWSDSAESDFRDGYYLEANLGIAHRPIMDDRLNVLFRYTFLEDLPGPDQVNIAGDVDGPKQRSHILSADVSYDLNRHFTLGAKYGYRKSEVADRGTDDFESNTAHLGIARLDYHVVHNWDIMLEPRIMHFEETDTTEKGFVAGVWRHFGNNVKAGVGYQWGEISDDLRLIEGRKEGAFLNLVAKF